jgi:hypothetical protein
MAVIYQDSGLNETLSVVEGFLDNEWDGIGGPIFCHDLYHDLGWVAGEDLAEAALIPGASRCEGGYYHAVLLTNPEMSPRTCSNLPYEDAFNCWHGAGHAAFSSQQNPVAVPRPCPVADTPDFTQICQQGYYMEYAHSLQWPVESLRFCLDVPDDVKFNCLQPLVGSVTVSQPSKVEDVLSVCAELDDYNLQQTCWRSAGFGIQSIQLSDPGFATPNRCVSNKYCQEGLKQAANWAAE